MITYYNFAHHLYCSLLFQFCTRYIAFGTKNYSFINSVDIWRRKQEQFMIVEVNNGWIVVITTDKKNLCYLLIVYLMAR